MLNRVCFSVSKSILALAVIWQGATHRLIRSGDLMKTKSRESKLKRVAQFEAEARELAGAPSANQVRFLRVAKEKGRSWSRWAFGWISREPRGLSGLQKQEGPNIMPDMPAPEDRARLPAFCWIAIEPATGSRDLPQGS